LGWSQTELAMHAQLSLPTITRMEGASVDPRHETVHRIFATFRNAGLTVTVDDDGRVHMVFSPSLVRLAE
jgi:predicted transcriptional regulator